MIIGLLLLDIVRARDLRHSPDLDPESRITALSLRATALATLLTKSISGGVANPGAIFFMTLAVVLALRTTSVHEPTHRGQFALPARHSADRFDCGEGVMATAVVLLCDSNFLVPTVGTAIAARSQISDPAVGIFVYLLDRDGRGLEPLRHALTPRGVQLVAADITALRLVKESDFNKTHVPIATMARLWIDDLLPPEYDKFLYLDGDLEIAGSLDELLALPVPYRGFLAAPDLPLLIAKDWGRSARETHTYISDLNVRDPADYFNAGVLLVDRTGWADVASEAFSYFTAFPRRCRYHDQSALNATAQSRRGRLSLSWNYQTDFMAAADPREWGIPTKIWHFTGFPKPWHAPVFPWSNGFGQSFRLGAAVFDEARVEMPCSANAQNLSAAIRGREKLEFRMRWVYPWRRLTRAQRIRAELAKFGESAQSNPQSGSRHIRGRIEVSGVPI